ncbi:pentapeptide repeat-containing protein [Terrimonas alba]|uniref:pentapeptide repeat-containing protein n=1 Tax=Terrimonas alba TaxID=3349636 RepID=UPI0035F4435A
MREFLQNIDWVFLLQLLIFVLALRSFTYLTKVFKRFEQSRLGRKSVLNKTSNFLEAQIVNETLLYKAIFFLYVIFLLIGATSILFSIFKGFGEFLKLPTLQNSWFSLVIFIGAFSCLFIAFPWLTNQFRDSKSLTDYEKLEKYLKVRELLNVSLQFRFANLQKAFLPKANLNGVDFTGANISCADLRVANLSFAKLTNADMEATDLREANLREANFENAKLSLAFLSRSILIKANLKNADLSEADLSGADLTSADLRNSNLSSANLADANLAGALLEGAILKNCNLNGVKGYM